MLGLVQNRYAAPVVEALRAVTQGVMERGPAAWRAELGAAGSPVEVRLEDSWLNMETASAAPPDRGTPPAGIAQRASGLLSCNAVLPGGAKFVLTRSQQLRIRVETSLEAVPEEEIRSAVSAALEGCESGLAFLEGRDRPAAGEDAGEIAAEELRERCLEAGLELRDGDAGTLVLAPASGERAPGGNIRAGISRGARLWIEAAPDAVFSAPSSRAAASVLLLTLGGLVRMARPAGNLNESEGENESSLAFEVCFERGTLTAAGLQRAMRSLRAAWQRGRLELFALQNEIVAREYLAARELTVPES